MHIPDGIIPLTIAIPAFIITTAFWVVSFKKIKLTEQQIPLMGLLTALFFAAMFINIPIPPATSVHLLGCAAIGLILGPFAGLISMSIILVMQSFFGDGGLVALGANVLNIGVIGVFIPCIIFVFLNKIFKPQIGKGLYATIFISAFFGDLLVAIAAGLEVGISYSISPLYGLSVTVPAMIAYHSVIGAIEGLVTVILIATLLKLRPDVLQKSPILSKIVMLKNKTTNDEEALYGDDVV